MNFDKMLQTALVTMMKYGDIKKCPFTILLPVHYREDRSCRCDDLQHRRLMIREWEYTKADFTDIPLREEE